MEHRLEEVLASELLLMVGADYWSPGGSFPRRAALLKKPLQALMAGICHPVLGTSLYVPGGIYDMLVWVLGEIARQLSRQDFCRSAKTDQIERMTKTTEDEVAATPRRSVSRSERPDGGPLRRVPRMSQLPVVASCEVRTNGL